NTRAILGLTSYFEPRSDDEDDTWAAIPLSNLPHHSKARLASTYDLTCNRSDTRRIFSGIRFRAWNPPAQKLRPCH
ncbi:hypothetical protein AVEN_178000-1, partial [Araneus ventricosus]